MTPDSEGLHEIANTTNRDRKADIVFVHGLGGASHGTWRHGNEGKAGHFFQFSSKGDGKWEREQIPLRTVDRRTYRIQRYRPRIEGLFARIERWTNETDPADTFWRSISKDNITTWYGKTPES